jgi:thiol-disulfide isomerase/thioredoxin
MNQTTNARKSRHRHGGRLGTVLTVAFSSLAAAVMASPSSAEEPSSPAPMAPQFAGISQWLNSNPLTIESQRGKVVVLHFWTFGCINCQHNLPFYDDWQKRYANKNLLIIGVHTPETESESVADNVVAQVKQLGITYPVAVDTDKATWQAYENRYWPSIYLIDKSGRIRYRWEGELEYQKVGGDKTVRAIIEQLLAEDTEH